MIIRNGNCLHEELCIPVTYLPNKDYLCMGEYDVWCSSPLQDVLARVGISHCTEFRDHDAICLAVPLVSVALKEPAVKCICYALHVCSKRLHYL